MCSVCVSMYVVLYMHMSVYVLCGVIVYVCAVYAYVCVCSVCICPCVYCEVLCMNVRM